MTALIPGDHVVYRSHQNGTEEHGTVIDIGAHFVFVRFAGDSHTKACAPGSLERA